MRYTKDDLTIEVTEHGAELVSLQKGGRSQREYLWGGDAAFWNRHSPILFPVVGKPFNNELHIGGRSYPMKQHGFARDSEFERVVAADDGLTYRLKDAYRPEVYPYRYGLEVAYRIDGSRLRVCWRVENRGEGTMYYQIGAHPAFLLPDYDERDDVHGYVRYYGREGGAVSPRLFSALEEGNRVSLSDGDVRIPSEMPITGDTFAGDALMIEHGQVTKATLCDKRGDPVLSVECAGADAYGVWAPHKAGCPFVCLEPWCGICDPKGFVGDISQREIIHALAAGGVGCFEYTITIHEL